MRSLALGAGVAALVLSFVASAAPDLQPTKRIEPEYPPAAFRAGTQGFVEVEYTVDATGKVASVSVVNAKPAHTFEQSAVRAVKQWEFQPGGGRGRARLDFTP
jgi:protein TonB